MSAVWGESRRARVALGRPLWKRAWVDLDRRVFTPVIFRARGIAAKIGFADRPDLAPTRILRWLFIKDTASVLCELSCDEDWFALTMTPPYPPDSVGVERFSQVTDAFQRQCELEAALIEDGFSLDSHESVLVGHRS